jgi:hypothetical protein
VANCQDRPFAVCLDAARQRSPEFASAVEVRQGEGFDLTVSSNAFKQFVHVCEWNIFIVTQAICYDLFLLVRHYHAQRILTSLAEYVKNDPVELAASALHFAHKFNEPPPADFERSLADHFLSCELDDFKDFHISILERIIRFPQPSDEDRFQRVFDRVFELHRGGGPEISVLFRGVNRFRLSENHHNQLKAVDGFHWEFLDHSTITSFVTGMANLHSANGQLKQRLDEIDQRRAKKLADRNTARRIIILFAIRGLCFFLYFRV